MVTPFAPLANTPTRPYAETPIRFSAAVFHRQS
jgi:hypothetical protein